MSHIRILIVEDEAIVAADLTRKLEVLGYEVAGTAARGDEAVALAVQLRPQLVLMDIHLKGPMDGIEAAHAIRIQCDIPVVYLTAHSDPATLDRAKPSGPFGYVLKPFDERDLASQIEMAVYRHQADREMRQQREWLRVTLTSIGDAVIATDAAARVTFANPVAEALTGWKAEEAAGQPIQSVFRIVNEQTGQPLEEPVARVLREGRAVELANHAALVTRDGRLVPIEDSAAPIFDASGQVIGVVLVFHDVTEKRRAEEALRRSSQFPEENPNPVLRISGDGTLLYANPPARTWLGTLGWQAEGALPAAVLAVAADACGQRHNIETEIGSPAGRTFWVWAVQPPGEDYVNLYGRDITDRKAAEEALRESAQRYELVLAGSGGGIWDWDVPGHKVVFSPRWKAMHGFAEDEVGDSEEEWIRGIHPEDAPRVMAAVQAHFEGRTPVFAEEYRARRKDGAWMWIADRGLAVRDAKGRVVRMAGSEIEITERKRGEETLRQAEELARQRLAEVEDLYRNAPVGLCVLDRDLRFLRINERLAEINGIPAADHIGKTVCELMPQLSDAVEPGLRHVLETGEPKLDIEIVSETPAQPGVQRSWLEQWLPIKDAEGRGVGLSIVVEETTARKRTEDALRQSREDLGRAQEVAQIGSWRLDTRRNVLTWSDENHRIFGVPQGTPLTYETFLSIVHPDDRQFVDAQWNAGLRGKPYDIEHRIVADGRVKWVREKAYLEFDDAGALLGGFGITQDISGRKRMEQALITAKAAAEAANQAKGRFLANISHELRTPMNAILGMVDLALPKQTDATAKDFLKTARDSADLLLALLNDLLDSAKIEAGKLELESAPFSLRRVMDQTTQVLTVRASEEGIAFSCQIGCEVPDALLGDQVRLRQVLLNLAGNAIKFTERGEVAVKVRAEAVEAEEATLEFAVRDTGIGIAPADLARLFQPFAQADSSTARRFGGTGLGLVISSSLVGMMGGRIWAESEPGRGSTFYFTVRLPRAKELPPERQGCELPAATTAQLRILLVEDNPANQKLATYILQDRGHTVEIAGNGREAICLAEQDCHDVILMDVQMPGMDGLEATAAIRKREDGGRRVPIIAMTAHAMAGDRERCLAAGMDAYLSKPIDGHEMIGLVETLATGSSLAMAGAVSSATPAAELAIFDAKLALKRCFNNSKMVQDMIKCFFEEAGRLPSQMRAALERGDLQEVGSLGHRLKGTVVYLGAEAAREAAQRVEQFCHGEGEPAKAEEAVRELERECELLAAALRKYLLTTVPR